MKALVYHGPGKKTLEDRPMPQIGAPTDAIVKIVKTTICGTDLHILKGDVPTCAPGRILGHEGIGVVDKVGGAVTAFHVVEHLGFGALVDFLDEVLRVLIPGGMLILETPNPENLRVGANSFYNNPTHRNPVPPEPLRFLVEQRGFAEAEIVRLHPFPVEERLKANNEDAQRLNDLLFGPQDYAVIARRA